MASLLEDIADKRSLIFRLATGCSTSGIALVVLSVAVLVLALRDTRDWFVPATAPGYLSPGELSDAYVGPEAEHIVRLQNTWTAETLPAVQAAFQRLLHPTTRKEYETKTAPDERKLVKDHKILLSQFVVTGHDIVKRAGNKRRVLVHGIRTLYIGGTPDGEAVTIDLGLEPDTTSGRPTGLTVMSLVPSHPLKVAGR